jgi:hypothetical protein
MFVAARRHVIARRAVVDTRASAIAEAASREIASGRVRWSIDEASTLTLDRVAPLLDQLDLARAAMFLRGPEQALREAYAAIGRQPALIE